MTMPEAADTLRRMPIPGPLNVNTSSAPADPWVHRSSGMRCATCIWFVAKERNGPINPVAPVPQAIGRCRRHAPTMGGYPVVFATDWCGDHRLDENKA